MPETNPAAAGDAIDQGTYTGGAVVVLDGSGDPVTSFGGGVSHVDNAAFTVNVSSGTPIMGYFGTDAVTAGRAAVIAILGNRQQKVTLYDSSAAEITTWPVTNAGLTELAAAINASRVDVAIAADGAGLLTTTAHDAAFGTAGTADAQVRSIQGIASMTPVQTIEAAGALLTAAQLIDNIVPSIIGPAAPTIDSYTHASFNLAAAADQVLVSSAANKQIWVYGIGFSVNVAGTVSFQDEDNVAITGVMQIGATGGMVVSPSGNFSMPIWKLGTDKDLEVDVVTSELDGWLSYAIVSV